jgi:hypothetical protein
MCGQLKQPEVLRFASTICPGISSAQKKRKVDRLFSMCILSKGNGLNKATLTLSSSLLA